MKPLARRSGFTTGKAGIDMEQVLLFIFYTLFFIVSSVVLLVVGLYSVWIHLDVKDEGDPEDRIFR
jgi:hypothetical protein